MSCCPNTPLGGIKVPPSHPNHEDTQSLRNGSPLDLSDDTFLGILTTGYTQ